MKKLEEYVINEYVTFVDKDLEKRICSHDINQEFKDLVHDLTRSNHFSELSLVE